MDLFYAMLNYCSQHKLTVLSGVVAGLCWVGNKLVNRHYDRKLKLHREELNQRGIKVPPDIPRPPE